MRIVNVTDARSQALPPSPESEFESALPERVKEIIAANESGRTNVASQRNDEHPATSQLAKSDSSKALAARSHL